MRSCFAGWSMGRSVAGLKLIKLTGLEGLMSRDMLTLKQPKVQKVMKRIKDFRLNSPLVSILTKLHVHKAKTMKTRASFTGIFVLLVGNWMGRLIPFSIRL